jgi:hypothetical protein
MTGNQGRHLDLARNPRKSVKVHLRSVSIETVRISILDDFMRKLVIVLHVAFHSGGDDSGSDRVFVGELPTVILDVNLEKELW